MAVIFYREIRWRPAYELEDNETASSLIPSPASLFGFLSHQPQLVKDLTFGDNFWKLEVLDIVEYYFIIRFAHLIYFMMKYAREQSGSRF